MKPDKLRLSLYLDFYGGLLTDKQRDCFELYCNQDLSLGEIAELRGTSRQSVHDAVSRAEAQLLRLEEVTGCLARSEAAAGVAARLEELSRALPGMSPQELKEAGALLRQAAQTLKE